MEITENKQWVTLADWANKELILKGEAYSNFAKSLRVSKITARINRTKSKRGLDSKITR